MEIFIATSIKSFDFNPTHPGPLPRASFYTSATQQIERSESKAARGQALLSVARRISQLLSALATYCLPPANSS